MTPTIEKTDDMEVKVNPSLLYRFVKRAFDLFSGTAALILLSPVFLATSIAIKAEDKGPAFFTQLRNGKDGKEFKMYKFRSMCTDAPKMRQELGKYNELDGPAFKLKDDPRITKVGRFIRKTSIDELPQLLNIIKGEMSVVGPRPLPTYETALLTESYRRRMLVKPGLICYWQIRGRNTISFDDWMRMDFDYINESGILTDLMILLEAVPAVLKGTGAE